MKILFKTYFIFFGVIISAQPQIGIKAGTNLSMIEGGGVYFGSTWAQRFQGGAVIIKPLNESWAFRTEISYTQKGGAIANSFTTGREGEEAIFSQSGQQRIGYLVVPLMFDRSIENNRDRVWMISGGIYGAIGIGGRVRYDETVTVNGDTRPWDSYDEPIIFEKWDSEDGPTIFNSRRLRRYDAGIRMSILYRWRAQYIDLTYEHGLFDIDYKRSRYIGYNAVMHTRSVQVSYVYLFPLRNRGRSE